MNGTFVDADVQNRYRNYQLANQMHRCTFSCFKYCRPCHRKVCRHEFPHEQEGPSKPNEAVIVSSYDRKKRRRINVLPARDNGNINRTFFDPLLTLTHAGNHDCQYISNKHGAAEYTGSYALKQERPDFKLVKNLLFKALGAQTECDTDLHRMKSVGKVLIDNTPIGSVDCMHALMSLQYVTKSRVVENVNALKQSLMTKTLELNTEKLDAMNDNEEPIKKGINSHLGKRLAYEKLQNQQRTINNNNSCDITLYVMLSNYRCTLVDKTKSRNQAPDFIKLNESGSVITTDKNKCFQIDDIVYKRRSKNAVINLCPYIASDQTNETSCYAVLLLHVPWPQGGEENLLYGSATAVLRLNSLLVNNESSDILPTYLKPLIERVERSRRLFEDLFMASE